MSLDNQTLSIFHFACSFLLTFYAHNCRLSIAIVYQRRERILISIKNNLFYSCVLVTLLTAGLTHYSLSLRYFF